MRSVHLAAAVAQEAGASPEGAESVNAAFNCGPAVEIGKENLFELDDDTRKAAQRDIKLNGAFNVVSMTYDGPIDD